MAKSASADKVAADMRPVDFRGAVQLIRTTKAIKDQMSGLAGKVSKVFSQVAGDKKVNGKAAKIFYALDNMTLEERTDVMRSLQGLISVSGWEASEADLVDQAEGGEVDMTLGAASGDDDDEDDDLEDLEDEDGEDKDDVDDALGEESPSAKPKAAKDRPLSAADFEEASEEELAKQSGRADKVAQRETRAAIDAAPKQGGAPLH